MRDEVPLGPGGEERTRNWRADLRSLVRIDSSFADMHVDQAPEDEDPVEQAPEPYLPTSRPLEKDEILEPDQSVYEMLHRMNVQWPCLSFDVLRVSHPSGTAQHV
jgi:hypothetical protein